MNRYMHDEYYTDPELFRRLAHRERERAIRGAVARLSSRIAALLGGIKARLTLHARPSHWLARLG